MPTIPEYAQFANRVYNRTDENRTPVPNGWTELQWIPDRELTGFSAGVYKRGSEIVIAYTGTNERKVKDFVVANLPAAGPVWSAQVQEAMELYLEVKNANPGASITFTGHSLGGGLASMMAVFFDRSAVTFDPAPFEVGARSPVALVAYAAGLLSQGLVDTAFDTYKASVGLVFPLREANVYSYHLEGEALIALRAMPIVGTIGPVEMVPIGSQTILSPLLGLSAAVPLHSMTLLAAMLTSTAFAEAVRRSPSVVELMLDPGLYDRDPQAFDDPNFIDRLYIAQVREPSTPLLDRFAVELNALALADGMTGQTTIRNALTVAAMEHYYFKSAETATALFTHGDNGIHFTFSGIGESVYSLKSPMLLSEAMRQLLGADEWGAIGTKLQAQDTWHVQSGIAGMIWTASVSAYDAAIGGAQTDVLDAGAGDDILIGGAGADFLTGGTGADTLIGGVGLDVLTGGEGNDYLMGGMEADVYTFAGAFSSDTIEDSDGQGVIQVTGLGNITGAGAAKTSPTSNTWQSADKRVTYSVVPIDATRQDLVIVVRDGANAGTVTVRNWAPGRLGITLPDAVRPPASGTSVGGISVYLSDPLAPGTVQFGGATPDFQTNGVQEYTDLTPVAHWVRAEGEGGQVITLGDGNDFVDVARGYFGTGGQSWTPVPGQDEDYVVTGGGNDTIRTGYGSDYISSGAGDDFVFSAADGAPQNHDPADSYSVDLVDAGAGNDNVWGGMGADILIGGAGNDGMAGMEGSDILLGGDDADRLSGDGYYTLDPTVFALTTGTLLGYTSGGDDIVFGGAGGDELIGGVGRDTLSGDAGSDTLYGDTNSYYVASGNLQWIPPEFHGDDVLNGGSEADVLVGGGGSDQLYGGTENDFLFGDQVNSGIAGFAVTWHGNDYLDGGDGADTLRGNGGRDTLLGGTGADFLFGEAEDMLNADGDDDYLDGGDGDDIVRGNGGNDTAYGGGGNDSLYGDSGEYWIESESGGGNDYLDGGEGNDTLYGHSGNDVLLGGAGTNWLYGQAGNDTLTGGTGTNWLSGGDGEDLILSAGLRDTIEGGAGRDVIRIAAGSMATVTFGVLGNSDGDIIILEGVSSTEVRIGVSTSYDNSQTARFTVGGAKILDVTARTTDSTLATVVAGLTFSDGVTWTQAQVLEHLRGIATSGDDTLYALVGENAARDGLAGNDWIYGANGSDTLVGGVGYDVLNGASGNDSLDGGADVDWLLGSDGDDSLRGGLGNDMLEGGPGIDAYQYHLGDGNDRIRDFDGDNRIEFGAGIDPLTINVRASGAATLFVMPDGGSIAVEIPGSGPNFSQYVRYSDIPSRVTFANGEVWDRQRIYDEALKCTPASDSISGFAGNDVIHGQADDDNLRGMQGNDSLFGDAGNDTLDGWWGDDYLDGGDGSDRLSGDYGNDVYVGGRGDDVLSDQGFGSSDIYRYQLGDGRDTVADDYGADRIELGNGVTAASTAIRRPGASSVELRFPDQGSISFGIGDGSSWQVTFSDGTVWSDALIRELALAGSVSAGNDTIYGFGDRPNSLDGLAGSDVLYGGAQSDFIRGGDGDDTLSGGGGSDTLAGGAGNDLLQAYGSDYGRNITYGFGKGGGQDTIASYYEYVDSRDSKVLFEAGVSTSEVVLTRSQAVADALLISIAGTADGILVSGFFSPYTNFNPVQGIEFADGTTWNLTRMLQEVANNTPQNLTIIGTAGIDLLTGAAGNDTIDGGAGADTMVGRGGDDVYLVDSALDVVTELVGEGTDLVRASATWRLAANVEKLELVGTVSIDATGNDLNNHLVGNGAANRLDGGTGADDMDGGAGNDTYVVDNAGDVIHENAGEGIDTVQSLIAWTLGSELENLVLTGTAAINGTGNTLGNLLTGNAAGNVLTGDAGNDRLDGGAGADTLIGGVGNDVYVIDNAGDVVTEVASAGSDSVESSISFTLGSNLENLTLTGTAAINASGNTLANVLIGNSAANMLNGGSGADSMAGGAGDDTYVVDSVGDVVTELANAGLDTVQSSVTFTLGSNLENLTLTGTTAINGTGTALENVLTGNSANNVLTAGAGNDKLDGGTGNDILVGGTGNDTYIVDSASDLVTELANEGTDTAQSSVTYTLGANVENLTLTGTSAINATGNALNNILTGNSAANVLTGGGGNDTYYVGTGDTVTEAASAGTDTVVSGVTWTLGANLENLTLSGTAAVNGTGNTLANVITGNSAANSLDGGTGADTLVGGAGNDTYVVDNAGDVVTELANEGTDAVNSSVTYTLAANVENLTLTGTTAINGTGNALDNLLTGNSANNTLTGGAGNDTIDGGTGNDTMVGGAGNDTYTVNVTTDVVTELASEGTDTVRSSVTWTLGNNLENLTLLGTTAINGMGNALNNVLTGNSANNTLTGGAGNDTLDGGAGNDTMLGGAGNDTYVVNVSTDVVTENANEGTDTVQSSVTWTLGNNLENLTLLGTTAINGTGNALNNTLLGNAGANVLTGAAGDDIYEGAAGNDTFTDTSTTSNDTYRWGIGSGLDTLTDSGGALDYVDLFAGIARSQLRFAQNGNHLELTVSGQTDKLTINNWYLSANNRIEEFRLSDGSKVLASEVQSLVGAMATFTAQADTSATTTRMTAMPVRPGVEMAVSAM